MIYLSLSLNAFTGMKHASSLRYGAIDLGTNACRLLISEYVPSESQQQHALKSIDMFSRGVRIGEGLCITQNISYPAMARSLSALGECSRRLKQHQVSRIRCVATEACRQAKNALDFVAKVYAETGLILEIIHPEEESLLALYGCIDLIPLTPHEGIVLDVGGGSTELLYYKTDGKVLKVHDILSIPLGVLRLHNIHCNTEQKRYWKEHIILNLGDFATKNLMFKRNKEQPFFLVCASGSVTGLVNLYAAETPSGKKMAHGECYLPHQMTPIFQWLWSASQMALIKHPAIGHMRAPFIVGGASLLHSILSSLPITHILASTSGVREGIVRKMAYENQEFLDQEKMIA